MSTSLLNLIATFSDRFFTAVENANTLNSLETIRIEFLSRNGLLAAIMDKLKEASLEEKRSTGPMLNALKKNAQQAFEEKKAAICKEQEQKSSSSNTSFDVTAYETGSSQGSLHIFTQTIEEIEDIFLSMGFSRADGLEIESDFYNFQALNIPADHPARDTQDTFWLATGNLLLRTHTSTIEIRVMEKQNPPIAIFAPGRVYRHEATDASHDFQFTQCEGLFVDKEVSISNLLATLTHFMRALFSQSDLSIRVRPSYFPFVEPGLEVDITCPFCKGGCSVCKKSGWIEIGGAGLTHPNVLRAAGIDPNRYSGFAFAFGIERLVMLKQKIHDIRLFKGNKLEFLTQF